MNLLPRTANDVVLPTAFRSPAPRKARGDGRTGKRKKANAAAMTADAGRSPIMLSLPYPPSANRIWRKNLNGTQRLSDEAKAFKQTVASIGAGLQPFKGEVSVSLDFHRPQRSGDVDNRIKPCLDALIGVAFVDDKQVKRIEAERFDGIDTPGVLVSVSPLSPANAAGEGRGA